MYIQAKRKAVGRPASSDCVKVVVSPGRIATRRLYHRVLEKIKPILLVCLLFLIILLCFKVYGERFPSLSEAEHVVTYGDTLWGIAEKYKPEGMSMSEYMGWVYERNEGGRIYPGDVVIVGVRS